MFWFMDKNLNFKPQETNEIDFSGKNSKHKTYIVLSNM